MFFGNYQHNLDNKGRLMIPSKMRDEAGERLYIMKVQKINSLPFNQKNARDYVRLQLSSVAELEVDKQGRIQLPTQLLSDYKIGKSVYVIGVSDHFEIWDSAAWAEYLKQNANSYEVKAEMLTLVK
ncbi:MAG: division/cell wall cluster transcriptional repressor MraZ [Firmicutes bacterium]|nr:division/cell wall cluster transcriptional repressor MraZ [Bacillota bacterium]